MTRSLVDGLEDEIRAYVLARMTDPSGELALMPLNHLLARWFNWQERLIPAKPRRVHVSIELEGSPEASTHSVALGAIGSEISTGEDLSPRLSSSVATAYTPTNARGDLKTRRDLDLLIADWGIHHLHLSPQRDGKRSGDLLFAVFRPDDAYLLQILPHGNWAELSLLETIVRNWPDGALIHGALRGGLSLTQAYAPDERLRLRQGGVSVAVQVDGRVYIPRGLSMAGTAVDVTRRADMICNELNRQRKLLAADAASFDDQIRERGFAPTDHSDWHPCIEGMRVGILDRITGVMLEFGQL